MSTPSTDRSGPKAISRTVASIGIIACGSLTVFAGLYWYDWFLPVSDIPEITHWHPERYNILGGLYAFLLLGLLVGGSVAILTASRRRRFGRHVTGFTVLLAVVVVGSQLASLGEILAVETTSDFLTKYLLFDSAIGGLLLSLGLYQTGQRRTAGTVLWTAGVLTGVVTLGYVFVVAGRNGLWRGSMYVATGAYIMLVAAALLVVAGAVLSSLDPTPGGKQGAGERESGSKASVLQSPLTSVVVLSLVGSVGVVLGTEMGWVVDSAPVVDASPVGTGSSVSRIVSSSSIALGIGLAGLVLGAVGTSVQRRWKPLTGPVVVLGGTALVIGPTSLLIWDGGLPAPGLYLTVGGGTILVVAGALLSGVMGGLQAGQPNWSRDDISSVLTAGPVLTGLPGVALVVAGTAMDWLVPLPATGTSSSAYTTVLGGIRISELVFIVVAVGIFASIAVSTREGRTHGGLLLLTTGVVAIAASVGWLVGVTGTAGVAGKTLLVAPGTYVTLLGAALLAITGTFQHNEATALMTPAGGTTGDDLPGAEASG